MKVLYFGSACDREWYDKVSNLNGNSYQVAQYMFEIALIKGLSNIEDLKMQIYYIYQEQYYPKGKFLIFLYKKKILDKKNMVTYCSNLNIPILKEFYNFAQGICLTLKWAIRNRNAGKKVIITAFNYTPLSLGILIVAKTFRIKRVNIFTDLSADTINNKRQKEMIWIKRVILPCYLHIVNFVEKNYDMYILFTKQMNKKVNPYNKPYVVIEGIFNNKLNTSKVNKNKAIMYAGTLSFEYGIKFFLDAFEQIENDELQLWIFGDGDMKEYIKKLCIRDNRVKYFGFKSHEEVFNYEKRATLLINTRNPEDGYTKYSFPSKTFEYMVSGTPFLTTKLAGIPEEYFKYLYTIDNYDIKSLKQKIKEIIAKPQTELDNFGLEARHFILENKNSEVQADKILNMICKTIKE